MTSRVFAERPEAAGFEFMHSSRDVMNWLNQEVREEHDVKEFGCIYLEFP